jgi:hypothetical protein
MKQYQVETKNQVNGKWNLYERFKCRYQLGYVAKQWFWPLSTVLFTRLAILDGESAEHRALCEAVAAANHVNRKHRMASTSIVAFVEARIIEVTLLPNQNAARKIIWENGDFCQKANLNGSHKT